MTRDEIIRIARDAGFVLAEQRDRRVGQSVSQADRAGKGGRVRGVRAENERIDEAMESLLIRCDDSDSAMYGTLSTSFVRDTVRIVRGAMEESE